MDSIVENSRFWRFGRLWGSDSGLVIPEVKFFGFLLIGISRGRIIHEKDRFSVKTSSRELRLGCRSDGRCAVCVSVILKFDRRESSAVRNAAFVCLTKRLQWTVMSSKPSVPTSRANTARKSAAILQSSSSPKDTTDPNAVVVKIKKEVPDDEIKVILAIIILCLRILFQWFLDNLSDRWSSYLLLKRQNQTFAYLKIKKCHEKVIFCLWRIDKSYFHQTSLKVNLNDFFRWR